jgi:hypothetical protein
VIRSASGGGDGSGAGDGVVPEMERRTAFI